MEEFSDVLRDYQLEKEENATYRQHQEEAQARDTGEEEETTTGEEYTSEHYQRLRAELQAQM